MRFLSTWLIRLLRAALREYLNRIQNDSMYLRYHIDSMTYDGLEGEELTLENYRRRTTLDMLNRTPLFERTEFYKNMRSDVIHNFKDKLKSGRIAVAGNYETIFGNPYEFLCAVIDKRSSRQILSCFKVSRYIPRDLRRVSNLRVCAVRTLRWVTLCLG